MENAEKLRTIKYGHWLKIETKLGRRFLIWKANKVFLSSFSSFWELIAFGPSVRLSAINAINVRESGVIKYVDGLEWLLRIILIQKF